MTHTKKCDRYKSQDLMNWKFVMSRFKNKKQGC